MKKLILFLNVLIISFFLPQTYAQESKPENAFKSLTWRPIGPANMGGRVTDIDGIPGDVSTFYISGADGGIFKTTNGGATFESLFTDQRAYSVGALAVAPSDHNVLWLGSGEGDPRNSVGYGNGVYRSLDGGKTWDHLGLDNTERIKRIVVDPNDPDVACVCALGHEWGTNEDRGVFRTTDGGKNWEKVLYLDEKTGCSDLAMELNNPRVLYAGMWTHLRRPWRFDGGGGETALYRSRDGGKNWEKVGKGLPKGPMARIGVAIAQSQPNIVYMITEFPNASGTLFRSEDRGDTWKLVNKNPNINFRPFYYSDIRVDPNNPNVLYSLSGGLYKSEDGGKKFNRIGRGVHGDHQSFWIDPANSNRLLSGSDGGYQVSYDAGKTWTIINNVELSQFYQMGVDNRDPYYIYGGLQDNGTWFGPSNSLYSAGILKRHWKKLAGGDGYYAVPIPGKEHEVYANLQGGVIFHVDSRMGNVRSIHPYPNKIGSAGDAIEDHKYRFNWDSPILISPHDPNTVYFGGNVVFKTQNQGHSWDVISPDLTTNDKSKQRTSGGAVYQDNTAAEFHCSILTIDESPVEEGVLWVGTDDGNLQLTRDGGKTWKNLNDRIKGLPAFSWFAKIHASEHEKGMAFVAVDQHRMDDFTPHVYMTKNYGKTWTDISAGLPEDDYVKVIRQDPHNADVLYCGMEHGIFISWDMGSSWMRINNNLPPASVRDLRIQPRERDLIAATHGRGVWILDDIAGLADWSQTKGKPVHLFPVRKATLWVYQTQIENMADGEYKAKNPAYGAYLNFSLAKNPADKIKVEIADADGNTIRTIEDTTAKAGLNRIVWDLRMEGATPLKNPIRGGWRSGPFRPKVAPGTYTASLWVDGQKYTTEIEVRSDPRMETSTEDYQKQMAAMKDLVKMLSRTHELINKTETLDKQLKQLDEKLGDEADKTLREDIKSAQEAAKGQLYELKLPPPNMSYRQRPRLRDEVRSLMYSISNPASAPTQPQTARVDELGGELKAAEQLYQKLIDEKIRSINERVSHLPQIMVEKTLDP